MMYICSMCREKVNLVDAYTLRQAGPKWSFRTFCEPCADKALAEYHSSPEYAAWQAKQALRKINKL